MGFVAEFFFIDLHVQVSVRYLFIVVSVVGGTVYIVLLLKFIIKGKKKLNILCLNKWYTKKARKKKTQKQKLNCTTFHNESTSHTHEII